MHAEEIQNRLIHDGGHVVVINPDQPAVIGTGLVIDQLRIACVKQAAA